MNDSKENLESKPEETINKDIDKAQNEKTSISKMEEFNRLFNSKVTSKFNSQLIIPPPIPTPSSNDYTKTLIETEERYNKLLSKYLKALASIDAKDTKSMSELRKQYQILEERNNLNHILNRVNTNAKELILTNGNPFIKFFDNKKTCETVVISIDIRRSTELMLKAKNPGLFSEFITGLSDKLAEIIISNYGVFDKFTGDGILAFFPKFYSGEEAIIRACRAAEECHKVFHKYYEDSIDVFNVFINDIGLGIGIDFGDVTIVNNAKELTVVGTPVVYACRFSGAKAGDTLLNNSALKELKAHCGDKISYTKTDLLIKNEGTATAFKVIINPAAFELECPSWEKEFLKSKEQKEKIASFNSVFTSRRDYSEPY